jgi:hypothetical protein
MLTGKALTGASMAPAQQIEERLDEIATELGAPRRPRELPIEEWAKDVENFCAVRTWSADGIELIDEFRRLKREYEHLKAQP